jgi:protein-tyrosine-phosphatase/predicted ATP-grasp superfamily ATP-dependent carboligase
MVRALVLDAHVRAAVETIQSLGRLGVDVQTAGRKDSLGFLSRYVRHAVVQPPAEDPNAFINWLRGLDIANDYTLIVPSSETSLFALLFLAEADPLRRKAVLAPSASILTALDKHETILLAQRLGVSTPESSLISGPGMRGLSKLPSVVKPIRSKFLFDGLLTEGRAVLVRSSDERNAALQYFQNACSVVEQEYVGGRGWGVELLYSRGQKLWHFCHERLHEGTGEAGLGSGSSYRRSMHAPGLVADAVTLLDALSWHGVAMVEFVVGDDGRHWLMEINPRLWGSLALSIDAGVDFPAALLALASGTPVPPQPNYRMHYRTRLFPEDLEWLRGRLVSRLGIEGLGQLFGLARPLLGNESWDYFDPRDLRPLLSNIFRYFRERYVGLTRKLLHRRILRSACAHHAANWQRFQQAACKPKHVLVVCYGNICRSPFAAAVAKSRFAGVEIASTGFYPQVGRRPPVHIQSIARILDIDLSAHRSSVINPKAVDTADLILLMDTSNFYDLQQRFPDAIKKCLMLGLLLPKPKVSIADPYSFGPTETAAVLSELETAIAALEVLLGTPAGSLLSSSCT